MADNYNTAFKDVKGLQIPFVINNSTHVYHQYTLKVLEGRRDDLMNYLKNNNTPSMVYYPVPLHKQEVFLKDVVEPVNLVTTELLSSSCISLPIHTEVETSFQNFIIKNILKFFKWKEKIF